MDKKKYFIIISVIAVLLAIFVTFIFSKKKSFDDALAEITYSYKIEVKKIKIQNEKTRYVHYKTITKKTEIDKIVEILSSGYESFEWHNLMLSEDTYKLYFYDRNKKLIAEVYFDSNGVLKIEGRRYNYDFKINDYSLLKEMIE